MGSTTDMNDQHKDHDTERIRRDIARTQREMGETIQEIEHRLSPHYLVQQTKESVRRAGVSTSQRFIDKVKENPIPAAMVGVGMWLLLRGSDEHSGTPDRVYGLRHESELDAYDDYWRDSDRGGLSRARQRTSQKVDDLRERSSEVMDEARDKVDMAREKVSDLADSARERTSELADTARDRAHEFADTTRRAAHRTRIETRDFMSESPLVAGLVALAVGAIVAAIIPETEREHELLGDKRDELLDRGKQMAREGLDRARQAAETVKENATSEARTASTTTSSSVGSTGLGASASGSGTTGKGGTSATNPNDIRR